MGGDVISLSHFRMLSKLARMLAIVASPTKYHLGFILLPL